MKTKIKNNNNNNYICFKNIYIINKNRIKRTSKFFPINDYIFLSNYITSNSI